MPAFSTVIWVLGAVVLFFFLWFVGTGMLRSTTTPLPAPPRHCGDDMDLVAPIFE